MIIIMIIILIMMMIMPTVMNTGARKDFRENVSRPNQISLLLPSAISV
jgi:uncharacterized membrane protein